MEDKAWVIWIQPAYMASCIEQGTQKFRFWLFNPDQFNTTVSFSTVFRVVIGNGLVFEIDALDFQPDGASLIVNLATTDGIWIFVDTVIDTIGIRIQC
jgi:hypothetical protein